MKHFEELLNNELKAITLQETRRQLKQLDLPGDFCSNDYLGFAKSPILAAFTQEELNNLPVAENGSGGSRLLSGNRAYTELTEQYIANFHNAPTGLLFNSGYDANVGLLSSIPKRGDTVICDTLIHASLIDGVRLSHATRVRFRHNDLADLENKLVSTRGNRYVVVESVYSMDGDSAPLKEISVLCERYNAALIVDEAHAAGVFGSQGRGLVAELQLESKIFARIITFGKALGCHGAIVLGTNNLREYLINFARSFIFTTAAPPHAIATIRAAYRLLQEIDIKQLHARIAYYNVLHQQYFPELPVHHTPIKTIGFESIEKVKHAADELQRAGFDVRAILSPTVPTGTERLRICLHNYNTEAEIATLLSLISKLKNNAQ